MSDKNTAIDLDKLEAILKDALMWVAGATCEQRIKSALSLIRSARRAAPEAPTSEQAHLIVSTAAGADRLAVLVSVKRGDITTVVYSRYHSMNGDSMGVECIPADIIATPAATTASASTESVELIELLKAIRPAYGAVGSRDVDVTAQQRRIDRAVELLGRPPAPSQEAQAAHAGAVDEQSNVPPPFAAPAQHESFDKVLTHEQIAAAWDAQWRDHGDEPFKVAHLNFARTLEVMIATRCRAEGGGKNDKDSAIATSEQKGPQA